MLRRIFAGTSTACLGNGEYPSRRNPAIDNDRGADCSEVSYLRRIQHLSQNLDCEWTLPVNRSPHAARSGSAIAINSTRTPAKSVSRLLSTSLPHSESIASKRTKEAKYPSDRPRYSCWGSKDLENMVESTTAADEAINALHQAGRPETKAQS